MYVCFQSWIVNCSQMELALHSTSIATRLVDILPPAEVESSTQMLRLDEKPDVSFTVICGLGFDTQKTGNL